MRILLLCQLKAPQSAQETRIFFSQMLCRFGMRLYIPI
jgi:hypothetical protein